MSRDIKVITGYIMYYDLLKEHINGSFFSKIDLAISIAKKFNSLYPENFEWEKSDLDFEETLENFLNKKIHNNFQIWIISDNVIKIKKNNYKTQCTQYSKIFTKKELKEYYKKEYCSENFKANGFDHFKNNFSDID